MFGGDEMLQVLPSFERLAIDATRRKRGATGGERHDSGRMLWCVVPFSDRNVVDGLKGSLPTQAPRPRACGGEIALLMVRAMD